MLSSPTQQKLFRRLESKSCTKKCLLRACSDNGPIVEISGHRKFSLRAPNLFNKLPKNIRQLNKENTFKCETKKYFYDRAVARFT